MQTADEDGRRQRLSHGQKAHSRGKNRKCAQRKGWPDTVYNQLPCLSSYLVNGAKSFSTEPSECSLDNPVLITSVRTLIGVCQAPITKYSWNLTRRWTLDRRAETTRPSCGLTGKMADASLSSSLHIYLTICHPAHLFNQNLVFYHKF